MVGQPWHSQYLANYQIRLGWPTTTSQKPCVGDQYFSNSHSFVQNILDTKNHGDAIIPESKMELVNLANKAKSIDTLIESHGDARIPESITKLIN